ncbi:relaxase/mobilization nuclease domain-containing protein [Mucilaginibacter sp. UR6-1]|uniref:relaxase/mobilization nuclease domain-containing protein n=1 Tax=Mucilaginibacter sp. UR6-1 TaxID=1435643 RepID=UPI001E5F5188|nr:relaxase/mobilization nuclease domain-containing protein [Mucilaginibacter sp. UR6-1]MCC8409073.1 relaxase/mobilization nuclease domain-containing protein [Mucilaginibacter sp. UR6-1]
MIASQKIGKSYMGALGYNLRKLDSPDPKRRAELLATNFSSMDMQIIKREVELVRMLRPSLNRYVYHTSLNFSPEEAAELDNEKLLSIAHRYMDGMGFTNNQYMIFRHYDAEHPHIHLLLNRISFDGSVVSDSNNFKRSEALLRKLEREYNLLLVEQSSYVAIEHKSKVSVYQTNRTFSRAPKKDEIEMAIRRGEPSDKMLLQEKLSLILKQRDLSMQDFVQQCEANNIFLLFNQQSTGRVSGITYFYGNFKAKGQALGSKFKWTELLKTLNYEQVRDSAAISEANRRTGAINGDTAEQQGGTRIAARSRKGNDEPVPGNGQDTGNRDADRTKAIGDRKAVDRFENGASQGNTDVAHPVRAAADHEYDNAAYPDRIQISDDVDDEQVYGRERKRGRGR